MKGQTVLSNTVLPNRMHSQKGVRNAKSQAPPQTYFIGHSGMGSSSLFQQDQQATLMHAPIGETLFSHPLDYSPGKAHLRCTCTRPPVTLLPAQTAPSHSLSGVSNSRAWKWTRWRDSHAKEQPSVIHRLKAQVIQSSKRPIQWEKTLQRGTISLIRGESVDHHLPHLSPGSSRSSCSSSFLEDWASSRGSQIPTLLQKMTG